MVKISSDASDFGWGGFILSPGIPPFEIRDCWMGDSRSLVIFAKETLALVITLQAGKTLVTNGLVNVHIDNMAFLQSREKQG